MKITGASRLLLLLLTSHAAIAVSLPDFEARYALEQYNLRIGTASLSLRTDERGHYTYEFNSWSNRWVAWFRENRLYESSRGEISADGIIPQQYDYQRSGDQPRNARLSFDWEDMSVENHVADSHWEMDIPTGTLDKLATQLGLMLALGDGERDVTYTVADGGSLKEYRYRVVGEETLRLPAGTFKTLKVIKLRKDVNQQTIIWVAPELHFLPVRIWRRDSDSGEYQSDLESFTPSLRRQKNTP